MGGIVLRVSSSGCPITLNNEAGLRLEINRRTELKSSEKIEQLIWRNDAFTGPTIVTLVIVFYSGVVQIGVIGVWCALLRNVVMCVTSLWRIGRNHQFNLVPSG